MLCKVVECCGMLWNGLWNVVEWWKMLCKVVECFVKFWNVV